MPQVCGWRIQPVPPSTFVLENYKIMMVYTKISLWYVCIFPLDEYTPGSSTEKNAKMQFCPGNYYYHLIANFSSFLLAESPPCDLQILSYYDLLLPHKQWSTHAQCRPTEIDYK